MSTEKKAFKVVYGLIMDNLITEKEAFNLVEGIFEQKIFQVPFPVPQQEEKTENPQEEVPKRIEVAGFRLPENKK